MSWPAPRSASPCGLALILGHAVEIAVEFGLARHTTPDKSRAN
jgi:hypothetical protein